MVGPLKVYKVDPMHMGRGAGEYYYRGKVKELGNKPYWSKYSVDRDLTKKKVKYHKGVFKWQYAHKGDVKHTEKGNK